MKVFVYGTLKQGYHNHSIMQAAGGQYLGDAETDGAFTMYSLGGFPGVACSGNTSIKGEVYEVDDITPVDKLEGYPDFYQRKVVATTRGPAWMYYLFEKQVEGLEVILSGEWTKNYSMATGW